MGEERIHQGELQVVDITSSMQGRSVDLINKALEMNDNTGQGTDTSSFSVNPWLQNNQIQQWQRNKESEGERLIGMESSVGNLGVLEDHRVMPYIPLPPIGREQSDWTPSLRKGKPVQKIIEEDGHENELGKRPRLTVKAMECGNGNNLGYEESSAQNVSFREDRLSILKGRVKKVPKSGGMTTRITNKNKSSGACPQIATWPQWVVEIVKS